MQLPVHVLTPLPVKLRSSTPSFGTRPAHRGQMLVLNHSSDSGTCPANLPLCFGYVCSAGGRRCVDRCTAMTCGASHPARCRIGLSSTIIVSQGSALLIFSSCTGVLAVTTRRSSRPICRCATSWPIYLRLNMHFFSLKMIPHH